MRYRPRMREQGPRVVERSSQPDDATREQHSVEAALAEARAAGIVEFPPTSR